MKILLLTPPLTQLNTPYPATPYLKGFLTGRDYDVYQADLGIELVLQLFSKSGFEHLFSSILEEDTTEFSTNIQRILHFSDAYIETIEPVIRFLQNKDTTLAHRICSDTFLPRASRFDQIDDLEYTFGTMGIQDQARHLATMYLEDIGDLIIETVTPHFGFSRYAEQLGMSATSFDGLEEALNVENHLIDDILLDILDLFLQEEQPDVVGFTVPFPGNLYGGLKCGQHIKANYPHIKVLMGGGYCNTELRELSDPRIFQYLDFITLDDGEGPILKILEHLEGNRSIDFLQRTFTLENEAVSYINACLDPNIPHAEIGTPDYSDLPLEDYLSVIEVANPMHRLWSDGRWNKLTIAHGCYWKRCSFCDVTLDYISRYETAPAKLLVDRIEQIVEQTGETGFHFVDEAAPPLSLRDLAVELIRRNITISWWANIRFEKTFSPDLCRLLAASGCIAVSGGLEVASDRLLKLMEKGVTIEQVARVTTAFTDAGVMVHAYLMYGFPTQTEQETIDSLEVVRQLFLNGCIQSGFWHRFVMTAHSPVGKNPEKYQVERIGPQKGTFANNDLQHTDPLGCDHGLYSEGLKKAIYNYMHAVEVERPVENWFNFKVPSTSHASNLIENAIQIGWKADVKCMGYRVYWLGVEPQFMFDEDTALLLLHTRKESLELEIDAAIGEWLLAIFPHFLLENDNQTTLKMIAADFEEQIGMDFRFFLKSEVWNILREWGLVLVRY